MKNALSRIFSISNMENDVESRFIWSILAKLHPITDLDIPQEFQFIDIILMN